MFLPLAALFALGAVVASFIGVLVGRLYTGESFLAGRSRCDACGAPIPPRALVPIFSFIFLDGRALCCGARLSLVAPVAELVLGVLFALAYLKLGFTLALPLVLLSLSLLLSLVLYDLAHQILPLPLLSLFVMAAATAGYASTPSLSAFFDSFVVAVSLASSLAAIHYLSRGRAMGFSDAPLVFGLSLLSGPVAFSGFIFSFWVGAVIGIALLARRPRGSRMGVEVPFAPFLAAGFLLAYFTQWNPFALTSLLVAFQ